MDTYSYVLNRSGATRSIRFYPFGRSFYHRAESLLDSILFAELKKLARSKAADTLDDIPDNEKKKEKILGKRNMTRDGNSNTKGAGANQGGNPPPGGSTKNQNKSGNKGLKKHMDDVAEYGNPETTYTMPIATDDYSTGSGVKKATKYKPVYGRKPKPRDTIGNDNTKTDLDTGKFEPLGKKVNVEERGADLQARHDAERERQQSYSVLKWNYEALRASEKSSKSQEDKPKLPDGKRAPPSERVYFPKRVTGRG